MIGIPWGRSALKSNTALDRGLMIIQLLAISMPSFFFGLLLIYLFAFQFKLFPVGGYGGWAPDSADAQRSAALVGLVCDRPALNMLDAVSTDYVRTAYAKGLSQRSAALRHMLPMRFCLS